MEHKNCWEYWDCKKEPRDDCPAYTTNSGDECFNVATNFCTKLNKDFKHCWECPWYKIVNPEDKQD